MTITILNGKIRYEFYNVPKKVAKAIITLLKECGNENTEIISTESEV